MNITRNIFPPEVESVIHRTIEVAEESGIFHPNNISAEILNEAKDIMFNESGRILFEHWKNGDELKYYEQEAYEMFQYTIIMAGLYHLYKLGILDCIEDENGEEVFWIKEEYQNLNATQIQEKLNTKNLKITPDGN